VAFELEVFRGVGSEASEAWRTATEKRGDLTRFHHEEVGFNIVLYTVL
jgi:hypothetical protein